MWPPGPYLDNPALDTNDNHCLQTLSITNHKYFPAPESNNTTPAQSQDAFLNHKSNNATVNSPECFQNMTLWHILMNVFHHFSAEPHHVLTV